MKRSQNGSRVVEIAGAYSLQSAYTTPLDRLIRTESVALQMTRQKQPKVTRKAPAKKKALATKKLPKRKIVPRVVPATTTLTRVIYQRPEESEPEPEVITIEEINLTRDGIFVAKLGGGAQVELIRSRGVVSVKCVSMMGRVMNEYAAKISPF